MDEKIILPELTITASQPRRIFMLAVLAALGLIFVLLGFSSAPVAMGWRVAFVAVAAVIFYYLPVINRSTAVGLTFDGTRLTDTNGIEICRLDQVTTVEKGALAFKPTNGFTLRLKEPAPRGWSPGIWWRFGRNVGVGGVLSGNQTKLMAEAILVAKVQA